MLKTAKQQLVIIGISIVLAAFSLGSIIQFTSPYESSWATFVFFYLSLFILSLGILTLVGLGLRQWTGHRMFIVDLGNSFRQAVLVSVLIIISLVLMSQGLLFWWVEASMILFLSFIEIFLNLKI